MQIPKAVRKAVWIKYIGKRWSSPCYVSWCSNKLDVLGSWHAGHNIPVSKGGDYSLENLRPICADCNLGMGNRYTINEWSNMFSSCSDVNLRRSPRLAQKYLLGTNYFTNPVSIKV